MNCRRVVNLMSAYVDGELTGEEMLAIRRHLSECPECAEEHETVLITKRAVASLAVVRPREDFAASILAKLDVVTVSTHQRVFDWAFGFLHAKVSPVAAALGVCGLALALLSSGEVETLRPAGNPFAVKAPVQQAGFLGARPDDDALIASVRPLKLADQMPTAGEARVDFVSLNTQ